MRESFGPFLPFFGILLQFKSSETITKKSPKGQKVLSFFLIVVLFIKKQEAETLLFRIKSFRTNSNFLIKVTTIFAYPLHWYFN